MIKRTTVRLPSELLKKAQRKAAAEGRTLTGLMEEGLRYVVSEKPAEKRERIDAACKHCHRRSGARRQDASRISKKSKTLNTSSVCGTGFK